MKTLKQQDQLEIESAEEWESAKHQIDKMLLDHQGWALSVVFTFKRKTENAEADEIIARKQLDMFSVDNQKSI